MNTNIPINKDEYYDVTFNGLTHEGMGITNVEGFVIFVPGALPDEQGKIKVTKVNKGYGFGKLIELTKLSKHRIEPECSIYNQCGGCQLQHMSYEGQLEFKYKHVVDVIKRVGKIDDVKVHPIIGAQNEWRYRNKAQVPVGEIEGGLVAGFYKKGSHDIVNMDICLIQKENNDAVIRVVKKVLSDEGVQPYNEVTHKGKIRHIMSRYGVVTNELMIVLVATSKDLPSKKKIIAELVSQIPYVKSIILNVNPKKTNVVLGDETVVLWGERYIHDYIGDIKFAISANSFFQVNPDQTKVLYDKALEYAHLSGSETVIDAYCGIGSISLFLAQKAEKVYGVEIVPQAIEDANRNAQLNNINNVEFKVGKAEEVIPNWYSRGIKADVIVVDPPRKGCDPALLNTILQMKPLRVVYVSCNPGTLGRDLRILEDGGYKTVEVQPVDMFPHTAHVECVILMVLKQ
jgi:23S rRNA (uracil1939-C5)-methyltransferase